MMRDAWIVMRKELVDALRDRRTLLMVLLSSVAMGPLVLVLLSTLVSGIEKRAEAREVVVVGQEHAPTLVNYLLRQTYTLKDAPEDWERQLQDSKLGDPVLVIPPGFEAALASGEPPVVEVVGSSANQRASTGMRPPADPGAGLQPRAVGAAPGGAGRGRRCWRRCRWRNATWPMPAHAPPSWPPWCPSSC
jgi:sodium transport system permease protein